MLESTGSTDTETLLADTFGALNRGDLDACVERLHPDFAMHHAGAEVVHGRETWRAGARSLLTAFPDAHVTVDEVVARGDLVAVRVRVSGTHHGDWFGLPATGRQVSWVSHEFYEGRDGLLTAEWICSDVATLFRELQ